MRRGINLMADSQITDDDREDLTAFLDGEADSTTRMRVESKLGRNAKMRAEADALKRTWELLDHLPRAEPDSSFTTRTLDKLAAVNSETARTIGLPALQGNYCLWLSAAAIVFALLVGWFI